MLTELTTWIEANMATYLVILIAIAIWSLAWKGTAIWKACKRNSKKWFWVLLIFNTAGILPIIYLLFTKKKPKQVQQVSQPVQ